MELVVVEHTLAVAVVVLNEEVLIGALGEPPVELNRGVVVEIPAAALGEDYCAAEAAVDSAHRHSGGEYAAIVEDVLIVLPIDNRDPELAEDHQVGVEEDVAAEADFVPATRLFAVAAVRFVLYL